MTYQNDPDRPRAGYGRRTDGSMSWLPFAIGAAVVVALILHVYANPRYHRSAHHADSAKRHN